MANTPSLELVSSESGGENVQHLVFRVTRLADEKEPSFLSLVETAAVSGIRSTEKDDGHDSVCISVKPSCLNTPGCRYCATGLVSEIEGKSAKQLLPEEVADQVRLTVENVRLTRPAFGTHGLSASFMGKGEPGLHARTVAESLHLLFDEGLITNSSISTTGMPICLQQLALALKKELPAEHMPYLQISIHAPLDDDRQALVRNARFQVGLTEVLDSAAKDYALEILPPGAMISLRLTLMKWGEGKCNFDDDSLNALAAQVKVMNEKYKLQGFGGFYVLVAGLNATDLARQEGIEGVNRDDLTNTVKALKDMGIDARFFAGDKNSQFSNTPGASGTFGSR